MFTLYQFELQKIIKRKLVWITGSILLVGLLIWGIGSALLPTNREYSEHSLNGLEANRAEKKAANQIAGRKLDQMLIDEMRSQYEEFIFYGDYEKALPYLDIYNFIGDILRTRASLEILEADSDIVYARLQEQLKENRMSDAWQPDFTEKPIIYKGYFDGWNKLARMMKIIACMEIMFISVCLSTVFPVEHTRKTDQLILCSRFGKKKLYVAKILAGLTIGVGFAFLLSLLVFGLIACLYGYDGFDTIIQFVLMRSFTLTIGQAAFILFGLSFVAAVFVSVFTMVLSELTKNSIATIGSISGIMIVTMFVVEMPSNFPMLSELWCLLPSNLVSLEGAFRYSGLLVHGNTLAMYEYAPIVYIIVTGIVLLIGKISYHRYQIEGR